MLRGSVRLLPLMRGKWGRPLGAREQQWERSGGGPSNATYASDPHLRGENECHDKRRGERKRMGECDVEESEELPLPNARLDYKAMAERVEEMEENVRRRKMTADVASLPLLFTAHKRSTRELMTAQEERNAVTAQLKDRGIGEERRAALVASGRELRQRIARLQREASAAAARLQRSALALPNFAHPSAPVGDESQARVVSRHGGTSPLQPGEEGEPPSWWRDHLSYAVEEGLVSFEDGAVVSGQKFCFLQREVALLDLALQQWALSRLMSHVPSKGLPFMPVATPDMVMPSVSAACGFQPRGAHTQVYSIENQNLCMVGTSEIPLVARHAGKILEESSLPLRLAGFGHCFRAEAGALGAASKGLYRLHQFSKVEMVVLSKPEDSEELLEELREIEEGLVRDLDIPFHVLDMPTEDLGAPASRKYDLEAWMPSRRQFGELCSASNCTDYQSRRLGIRYKDAATERNYFVHTLNATAVATPRVILAILENHQQADRSVRIPPPLVPFMGGIASIQPRTLPIAK